jgi:hypothetical protein
MKMHDKITNPARASYSAPPKAVTGGPETWVSKPATADSIGGKRPGHVVGASIPGPDGPAPKQKV